MNAPVAAVDRRRPEERALRHVAIIMDGNGRWARLRGLPRAAGHRAGAEAARRTLQACIERRVEHLTLFAFSSENWRRPEEEIEALMGLLCFYLEKEVSHLKDRSIRLDFIGDRDCLASDILDIMAHAERETAAGEALKVHVALNYGARDEIARAARTLARECMEGALTPEALDEAALAARLDTRGAPDPDLVIRTSGEQRLSNFLVWQAAYAELVFVPVLWPDFGRADFDAAVETFHKRERRYGAVAAS